MVRMNSSCFRSGRKSLLWPWRIAGVGLPAAADPGNTRAPENTDHDRSPLFEFEETSVDLLTGLCRPRQHQTVARQGSSRPHRHDPEVGITLLCRRRHRSWDITKLHGPAKWTY